MDLLANDLSVHEQFHDSESFLAAMKRLWAVRRVAEKFDRKVSCHVGWSTAYPIPGVSMQHAIARLRNRDLRHAMLLWMTRDGPFWDVNPLHNQDDYLECDGDVVTANAIGEAAVRCLSNLECGLVSLCPSAWVHTPIEVTLRHTNEALRNPSVKLENWWDAETLEKDLAEKRSPVLSWNDLQEEAVRRFTNLYFGSECFRPLQGVPFAKASAERLVVRFNILNELSHELNEDGSWTNEGHRLYTEFFTGDTAPFSDSSITEKQTRGDRMTFPHPEKSGETLICSWHGKVRHQTLRFHFSWPPVVGEPIYVVYVGRHLT